MKRAAIYARVSTNRQLNGYSIDTQIERCKQYADVHSLKVVNVIQDSVSGATLNRPGLDQLRDAMTKGDVEAVIIYCQDRLSRDTAQYLILREEFIEAGVDLHYVDKGMAEDTPESKFMEATEANFAELWKAKIVESCRRGKRGKAKSGKVVCAGGRGPYGYSPNEEHDMLVINEEEADVVRMIFGFYVHDKLSMKAIAQKLSDLGILTRADYGTVDYRKINGRGVWNASTISKILHNKSYTGVWTYTSGDEVIEVEIPAIIEAGLFEAAQKQAKRNGTNSRRNKKYNYLLSGMLRCGECGRAMRGTTHKKTYGDNEHLYQYYLCSYKATNSPGFGPCDNNKHYKLSAVEGAVWQWIKDLLMNEDNLRQALEEKRSESLNNNSPQRDRLSIVNGLIAKNEARMERLLDLYLESSIEIDMLKERESRLKSIIESLEGERQNLLSELEVTQLTEDKIDSIVALAREVRKGLAKAEHDFEFRRGLVELLDVQVRLNVEDGQEVAYVSCAVTSNKVLHVKNTSSKSRE